MSGAGDSGQRPRYAAAAGVGALASAAVLLAVLVVLTAVQREFLESVGWSPIGRSPTQWPSILAAGPGGAALSLVFAASAVAVAYVAITLGVHSQRSSDRVAALGLLAVSLGLAGVAFPADAPGGSQSWHASVHDSLYPLVPLGLILAAVTMAVAGRRPQEGALRAPFGVAMVAAMVAAFLATGVDPIAQLARYFAFGLMLAWVALLGRNLTQQSE